MRKQVKKKGPLLSLEAEVAAGLWRFKQVPEEIFTGLIKKGHKQEGIHPNISLAKLTRKCFVKKEGRTIGLIATVDEPHHQGHLTKWLYYPIKEHLGNFDYATRFVHFGGPARYFKGSVGSIKVATEKGNWVIKHIQSHFKTTKHIAMGVNRALATKYGGWRHRLLSEIFKEAKRNKKRILLSIGKESAIKTKKERIKTQQRIFREVAEKEGFKVKKEGKYLVARCDRKN